MLTKELETEVTVKNDGQLEIKETTIIFEDGVAISRTNHRKVIDVGDDVAAETEIVKDIASTVHTKERIDKRRLSKS